MEKEEEELEKKDNDDGSGEELLYRDDQRMSWSRPTYPAKLS